MLSPVRLGGSHPPYFRGVLEQNCGSTCQNSLNGRRRMVLGGGPRPRRFQNCQMPSQPAWAMMGNNDCLNSGE